MLDSFRKASQTWVIKILFALLIVSFGVWGIGDVVRVRATSQPALTVGDQKFDVREVNNEFRREFERLQAMYGNKLTIEQARQMGLMDYVIQQMVSRTLLDQAAHSLGFTVDDDHLRRIIAQTPAFQNADKKFDMDVYRQALYRAGFTEQRFLATERADLARRQLVEMVTGGIVAPSGMADPLFRYAGEQRVAELIDVPADRMPAPAAPAAEQLQAYWKAHSRQYMAPETRSITAVILKTSDVQATIKPSASDIEKSYQVRLENFMTPERRTVDQVLFADENAAKGLVEKVRDGATFDQAAKAAKQTVNHLGAIERNGLPLPGLADPVFGAADGAVVGPVQTSLGWHVLHVTAIDKPHPMPLAQVRDRVAADLAHEQALNQIFTLSTKLEDSLGSGASIEEAANSIGLKPVVVPAVDGRGHDADGKPVAGLPPAVVEVAFKTEQGSATEVQPLGQDAGYYALRVDKVTPSAVRPFESVQDKVKADWTTEKKIEAARARAKEIAGDLAKGKAVPAPFKAVTTQPFTREGDGRVPLPVVSEIFKAKPGSVSAVATEGGAVVARLKDIVPADPAKWPDQFNHVKAQLAQSLGSDIFTQYQTALQNTLGVSVNQGLIKSQGEQ